MVSNGVRRTTAATAKIITLSGSEAPMGKAFGVVIDNLRTKVGAVGIGTKEQVPAIEPVQKGVGIEPVIRTDGVEPEKHQPAAVKMAVGVVDIDIFLRVSDKATDQGSNLDKPFITVLKGFEPVLLVFLVDINAKGAVEIDTNRGVDVVADQKAINGIVIGTDIGIGAMVKIVDGDIDLTTNGNHIVCEPDGVFVMPVVPVNDDERVFFPDINGKDDVNLAVDEPTIKVDVLSPKGLVNILKLMDEPP